MRIRRRTRRMAAGIWTGGRRDDRRANPILAGREVSRDRRTASCAGRESRGGAASEKECGAGCGRRSRGSGYRRVARGYWSTGTHGTTYIGSAGPGFDFVSVAIFAWMLLGRGWSTEERKRSGAILVLFVAS